MSLIRTLFGGLIIVMAPVFGWAATWDVDQANSGCSDSTCTPCCTIQGAVNQCLGGDMVSIAPGTYAEQVDIRNMAVIGNITLMAESGPGTVLVAPTSGHTLRHGGAHDNAVNVIGVDFTSAAGSACVYLDHQGSVFLSDVTANNCGYTAFVLDNTGNVTMERCTGNNSGRYGIAVDGAADASLTDCTGNSNPDSGIVVYTLGSLDLINPTTVGNTVEGISVHTVGATTITGATVTDNDRTGIAVETSSTLTISNSTISGSWEQGIDVDWFNSDPVDGVTFTNLTVTNNGIDGDESGVRLRDVTGPVVATNCAFDNNGVDGLSVETSVIGDLEIQGGHAHGNLDDGYDIRVVGNVTAIGAGANGNNNSGIAVGSQATVYVEDCVANNNSDGAGINIEWQDPEPVDEATVIDCTANSNGIVGGSEGIFLGNVVGQMTVVGSEATGNGEAGVSLRDCVGPVLIRDVTSVSNGEDGIKLDVGGGPLTVVDSRVGGNAVSGLSFAYGGVDVDSISISRNTFNGNAGVAVDFYDIDGPGPFEAKCNDVFGNGTGMYLSDEVTVDARHIWWGDPTGPSGDGSGAGDAVIAEDGGIINYTPWLAESFTAPISGCPLFEADFESGLLAEWDGVVP